LSTSTRKRTESPPLPDLGIPPFIVNWFMQDPLKALIIIACVVGSFWTLCNPDSFGDADGASDGGDGGGD
jgi:hypothetical protein